MSKLINSIINNSLTSTDYQENLESILAVIISKTEAKLTQEFESFKRAMADCLAKKTATMKLYNESLEELARKTSEPHIKALSKPLAAFGSQVKFGSTHVSEGMCIACIYIKYENTGMTLKMKTPISKKITDLWAKADNFDKEYKKLEEQAVEVKKKLGNIPLLERQVKAKFAEAKLRSTKNGTALLEEFLTKLDDELTIKI